MSERRRLDNLRPSETFNFEVGNLRYTATVSRFSDGRVAEVDARDAAVAASLAFQFGCPLDVLRRALLRDPHGKASSPLGCALDQLGGDK
jgi:hypothetical protein